MIAKGHNLNVKSEMDTQAGDRSSKALCVEPMNATFHPVGE